MSYHASSPYSSKSKPASYTYNRFREPDKDFGEEIMSRVQYVIDAAKRVGDVVASIMSEDYLRRKRGTPYSEEVKRKGWWRQAVTVVLALQCLWAYTLYWGERSVYSRAIWDCDWRWWEQWVCFTLNSLLNGHALI
jgi:hypothetical protein